MAIMKNSYHPHYHTHTPKLGAGIGLGIVAALDVKPSTAGEMSILIKHSVAVSPQPSPRSDPVPVITNRTRTRTPHDDDDEDDEISTYVTCRGPTNPSVTRVYRHPPSGDGGVLKTPKPFKYSKTERDDNNNNNNNNNNKKSDFLSSCDMCSKTLEGKDIYMYRGEKAFCSGECRERQIASDERKEKMSRLSKRKATSSSSEMVVSRSPCYYETGQIFTTGIIATY